LESGIDVTSQSAIGKTGVAVVRVAIVVQIHVEPWQWLIHKVAP
jgi:hypothetical protein